LVVGIIPALFFSVKSLAINQLPAKKAMAIKNPNVLKGNGIKTPEIYSIR
jgi:hypothetical protein